MGTGEFIAGGSPVMDWHCIQGGVEILLVASCYRNREELWPCGHIGQYADFTIFFYHARLNLHMKEYYGSFKKGLFRSAKVFHHSVLTVIYLMIAVGPAVYSGIP